MAALNGLDGPVRGVILHRQRHQLEHGGGAEQDDSHQEQGLKGQNNAQEQQNNAELRSHLGHRDQGRAQTDGTIAHSVLHRMPRLVGGNTHRSDGGAVIDRGGETDHIGAGIVVIRQLPGHPLNAHVIDPVLAQHRLRRLGAGEIAPVGDAGIFVEIGADLGLGVDGNEKHRQKHHPIGIVVIKQHRIILSQTLMGCPSR